MLTLILLALFTIVFVYIWMLAAETIVPFWFNPNKDKKCIEYTKREEDTNRKSLWFKSSARGNSNIANSDGWLIGSASISVVTGIVLIVCICTILNNPANFAQIEETYNIVAEQAKTCPPDPKLRENVFDMNAIIVKHKTQSKSPWTNVWYSSHLGSLPYIEYKDVPTYKIETNN